MDLIEKAAIVGRPKSVPTVVPSGEATQPDWTAREEVLTGFMAGLRRAKFWHVPPNWSALDWYEELHGIALAAAWQAEQDHDPAREVPIAGFVFTRVKARTLTRYRQEWRHALRTTTGPCEMFEAFPMDDRSFGSDGATFDALEQALQALPQPEQWLLEQLFWQRRTESSIAEELLISQPAVNKRKRAALVHLRAQL